MLVAVLVPGKWPSHAWDPTVAWLRGDAAISDLAVGSESDTVASLVTAASVRWPLAHILVVHEPLSDPPGSFESVSDIAADRRVGVISFPGESLPASACVSVELLPVAYGRAVVVTRSAIELVGCGSSQGEAALCLAGLSLAAQRRGLISVRALGPRIADSRSSRRVTAVLSDRSPRLSAVFNESVGVGDRPLSGSMRRPRRISGSGLRVLIDGTCLGELEMGTQVHTLRLIDALTARNDVGSLCIAMPGPTPGYAAAVLTRPKVETIVSAVADFSEVAPGDVLHRPFQPVGPLPIDSWRSSASRIVISLHDLIAYEIGDYHADAGSWMRYRSSMRAASAAADGVTYLSEDSHRQAERNRLDVPADRSFVVPCGTDHLLGTEHVTTPIGVLRSGTVASRFMLVLGANYAHKNRDLAIAGWQELRRRGFDHELVLAGAAVPHGSSLEDERRRIAEYPEAGSVVELGDVCSSERNWLLRHADVVLYPTSAEGFGLVPFEAAAFGTPTVAVGFGPLVEMTPSMPIWSAGWSVSAIADAAEQLLTDPALAARQVTAVKLAGGRLTWTGTADAAVEVYHRVLDWPAR